jgi:hypothetical protein
VAGGRARPGFDPGRAGDITDPGPTDRMYQRVMEITGAEPLPHGVAPNRAMIDQLIRHTMSQRILDKPFTAAKSCSRRAPTT